MSKKVAHWIVGTTRDGDDLTRCGKVLPSGNRDGVRFEESWQGLINSNNFRRCVDCVTGRENDRTGDGTTRARDALAMFEEHCPGHVCWCRVKNDEVELIHTGDIEVAELDQIENDINAEISASDGDRGKCGSVLFIDVNDYSGCVELTILTGFKAVGPQQGNGRASFNVVVVPSPPTRTGANNTICELLDVVHLQKRGEEVPPPRADRPI